MAAKKKMVRDRAGMYIDLEGTIPEVIKRLQELQRQAKAIKKDIFLSSEPRQYENGYELTVMENRLETDKEFDRRVALEIQAAAAREERERREFERLSKKFKQ